MGGTGGGTRLPRVVVVLQLLDVIVQAVRELEQSRVSVVSNVSLPKGTATVGLALPGRGRGGRAAAAVSAAWSREGWVSTGLECDWLGLICHWNVV